MNRAATAEFSPLNWRPGAVADLIGPARRVAEALIAKARRLRAGEPGTLKVLLYGPPGVGKTTLAELVAAELCDHPLAIEDFNGKMVTVETVKAWMGSLGLGSLFSQWSVRIINELDRCTRDAQDLLLSYLDKLPPGRAMIGTSNLQLDLLTERFQTRFQAIKLLPPDSDEIAAFLAERWDVDPATAQRIAVGCGGCVRAALADLEGVVDLGRLVA